MTEQELPEGYHVDESDVHCIILYYLFEVVGTYRAHSEQIIFDAAEHKRLREEHDQPGN